MNFFKDFDGFVGEVVSCLSDNISTGKFNDVLLNFFILGVIIVDIDKA